MTENDLKELRKTLEELKNKSDLEKEFACKLVDVVADYGNKIGTSAVVGGLERVKLSFVNSCDPLSKMDMSEK